MPVAPDRFTPQAALSTPMIGGIVVVPSDTALNELAQVARALMIGVGGTLHVLTADGTDLALTVPAGLLNLRVRQVFATGTAATSIVALW